MKKIFFLMILLIYISCTSINYPNHPKWLCNKKIACKQHPILEEPIKRIMNGGFNSASTNYKYEDFPNEDDKSYIQYGEQFAEGGQRFGKILNGYKESKWLSGDADFDENGNVYAKGGIWREEYFKNGLRDSIYRRFDNNRKVIYETTFKMGTGLWKEFHSNGSLYFEMYTKNGYFTDTLRLHDDTGRIVGKRLYKNDSLIYSEGLPCFPYRPDSFKSD